MLIVHILDIIFFFCVWTVYLLFYFFIDSSIDLLKVKIFFTTNLIEYINKNGESSALSILIDDLEISVRAI